METGRDCIRRLLQIIQVFWLGIESNYQESDRLHRVAEKGGGGGGCVMAIVMLLLRFFFGFRVLDAEIARVIQFRRPHHRVI